MASDYVPALDPGDDYTVTAAVALAAGQVVEVTGDSTVSPTSGASDKWLGVAAFSVGAGQFVTVKSEGVQWPVASAAITSGQLVESAVAGQVAPFAGTDYAQVVGLALTSAAAAGDALKVRFVR